MTVGDSPDGETSGPPTPKGVPVLGNGLAFSRDPVGAMEQWADLGDVVRLKTPGQTTFMVTHPDLIKRILVEDHEKFSISDAQRETFEGPEDHAMTTTTGERWTGLRTALQPAFTRGGLDRYADRMTDMTARHVEEWGDGERIDLYREMWLLTVNHFPVGRSHLHLVPLGRSSQGMRVAPGGV